jgi:hypothetical protein
MMGVLDIRHHRVKGVERVPVPTSCVQILLNFLLLLVIGVFQSKFK